MSETDEAVGRLEEVASGWSVLSDDRGRASGDIVKVLTALARVTEERDTAQRDAGAFRVAVSLALGPCAPEHEGTPVVEAIQRMREERDAANAHLALLEGEGHTGCNERIYQAEQERDSWCAMYAEAVKSDVDIAPHLATLRERLAGEACAHRLEHNESCPATNGPTYNCLCGARDFNKGIDRAVAVIRGEGT